MSVSFVILAMIFLHIVADFNLQGIMGEFKQKSWWQKNYPEKKYKYDYISVLLLHSFSWTFCIMLPLAIYYNFNTGALFVILAIANTIVHALIDHLKANMLKINLIVDQMLHMWQIAATAAILLLWPVW